MVWGERCSLLFYFILFFLKRSAQVCDCWWGALWLGGGDGLWGVPAQSTLQGAEVFRGARLCAVVYRGCRGGGSGVVGAPCLETEVRRGCHHKGHPTRGRRPYEEPGG